MKTTKKIERSWTLSAAELKAVRSEKQPNPYNRGAYHFSVVALYAMGANKWHTIAAFEKAFATAAGAEWFKGFKTKEVRNEETAKDVHGKILTNLFVMQRTNDYAAKMVQCGMALDLKREGDAIMVRLNTASKVPQKLGRARKANPTKEVAKAKAKAEMSKRPPILEGRAAVAALKAKK